MVLLCVINFIKAEKIIDAINIYHEKRDVPVKMIGFRQISDGRKKFIFYDFLFLSLESLSLLPLILLKVYFLIIYH